MPDQNSVMASKETSYLFRATRCEFQAERSISMRYSSYTLFSLASGVILGLFPLPQAQADDSAKSSAAKQAPASKKAEKSRSKAERASARKDQNIPEQDLLDAVRNGLVTVDAEGKGDGRITLSITNLSRRQVRVVLPPGIIAQGATGQFGGMGGGGMGGGMGGMGGGMGGGGMGGGMGGMGGGMGGGGMGGGMGGRGGMMGGTMPSTMGMMMLARMIMYFCGDPDSWDQRSLMIGMMGGGMGGMGGGMMGGMGGGMGGMGGGMRSVPPTGLPFATIGPNQTRHLPTRVVSISAPNLDDGLILPQAGEKLNILGDVSRVTDNPRVQKALRRLAVAKAPTSLSQLVMWRVAANLDWNTIAQLSQSWANRFELVLAQNFVDHLDDATDGETGRLYFEVDSTGSCRQSHCGRAYEGPGRQNGSRGAGHRRDIRVSPRARARLSNPVNSQRGTGAGHRERCDGHEVGRFWQVLAAARARKRQSRHVEIRGFFGRGNPQSPGSRSGRQGLRPERKGQAGASDSHRERLSTHPEWVGAGWNGKQQRRSAQGALGHRDSSCAAACSFQRTMTWSREQYDYVHISQHIGHFWAFVRRMHIVMHGYSGVKRVDPNLVGQGGFALQQKQQGLGSGRLAQESLHDGGTKVKALGFNTSKHSRQGHFTEHEARPIAQTRSQRAKRKSRVSFATATGG